MNAVSVRTGAADLARTICKLEGKKKGMSLPQIQEVLGILADLYVGSPVIPIVLSSLGLLRQTERDHGKIRGGEIREHGAFGQLKAVIKPEPKKSKKK